MRLKGISLPVNTVIIVALAVMVLLLVAAFLGIGIIPMGEVEIENAWNNACNILDRSYHCDANAVENIDLGTDINKDGKSDTLLDICRLKFHDNSLSDYYCRNKCCRTTVTEGMGCKDYGTGKDNIDNRDCRFGFGRSDWICSSDHCCPSTKSWNGTACSS